MRKLIKYLKNYKKECILAPLLKMLEAAFELTVPIVIADMIDTGIRLSSRGVITKSFWILVVLGITGLVVSCTAQFFAAKAATGFSKELRHDLFSHILSFGFTEIDSIGTSTMINRMTSDVNILQNGVNLFLRLFLRSPFIVFGAIIMAFTIDVRSAFIFIAVILILSVSIAVIMKQNIPLLGMAQKKLDDILRLVRENLSGARVVRAFTLEDEQISEFEDSNSSLTSKQLKAGSVSGLLNPLTYVIVNIGIVMLISTGNMRMQTGALSKGQIVALYNYMSQILLELIKFANLIVTINKTYASAIRVNSVFDISTGMDISGTAKIGRDKDTAAVEFENVSLKYHEGADEAIENVSFSLGFGQTLGIIGGTGSGKSSVASLIPRFYDATSGVVRICGMDISKIGLDSLRKTVGIVMQKPILFEGTIRDNLRWGNENASDEELLQACADAVCKDVVDEKGGLDAEVEAGGRNFSGGQKQRLSIARVLASKPDILILDDSASALDYMTDRKLRDNIAALEYNPAVIIIAQRTVSVSGCDRILVLDDGVVAGYGTHEQLLDSCEVYKEIHRSQYE